MLEYNDLAKFIDELCEAAAKSCCSSASATKKSEPEKKLRAHDLNLNAKPNLRPEPEKYDGIANTVGNDILSLKKAYIKKGFSDQEAFTLAVETFKECYRALGGRDILAKVLLAKLFGK